MNRALLAALLGSTLVACAVGVEDPIPQPETYDHSSGKRTLSAAVGNDEAPPAAVDLAKLADTPKFDVVAVPLPRGVYQEPGPRPEEHFEQR